MRKAKNDFSSSKNESLTGTIFLVAFGVFVLAFLIVIDREEWFSVRPASGTATAMAYAAQPATANNQ